MSTIDDILAHLKEVEKNASGYTALCPAHDDTRASLSVGLGRQGQVLLHCFAGCSFAEIVAALGLKPADLWPHDGRSSGRGGRG